MTRKPTCADVWAGDRRCTKAPHSKDEAHSDGERFWNSRNEPEVFVAEWVRRSRENRLAPADKTPWAPR